MKYKLTDAKGRTYGGTQWGPGVRHAAAGDGQNLCSDGWIHYYDSPELAVLMNPIGAAFLTPRLWEFVPEGEQLHDHGLKSGCKAGTTIREVALPVFSLAAMVRWSILVALWVEHQPQFRDWAERWLSGQDRSAAAARATDAADADAAADAYAAAAYAAAADAAYAAYAAYAAVAARAAYAAVYAAHVAQIPLDLTALARQAQQEESA